MRRLPIAAIALLFVSISAFAQEPRGTIERFETRVRLLSASVRRDAYIVGQLAAAGRALNDFQNNVAISRAIDRVNAALKRASENPAAPAVTIAAINNVKNHLVRAQDNAAMVDLAAEQKFIFEQTHVVSVELFGELEQTRRERQALADFLAKLQAIANELDSATTDALGSTLSLLRVAPGV